jgi:hypothetical protein
MNFRRSLCPAATPLREETRASQRSVNHSVGNLPWASCDEDKQAMDGFQVGRRYHSDRSQPHAGDRAALGSPGRPATPSRIVAPAGGTVSARTRAGSQPRRRRRMSGR